MTSLERRGILHMPDFEQRNWLWQYDGSQPPIPFWDGQLIAMWLAPKYRLVDDGVVKNEIVTLQYLSAAGTMDNSDE